MHATHRLAQRPALPNCDCISIIHTERWADVRSKVGMSLLVSGVFGNKVKVFAADDESSVHFRRDDFAGKDSTSNGDHAGKWTFLVCRIRNLVKARSHQSADSISRPPKDGLEPRNWL
jgi:hypothetical protein